MSSKRMLYGVLGGVIGAGLGGIVFDPIAMLTHGGAPSRAVGFGLVGLATGVAVGLVESALKDRWLYVTAGPLAGKQFILYKPRTVIGSDQKCDIYLFKDSNILPKNTPSLNIDRFAHHVPRDWRFLRKWPAGATTSLDVRGSQSDWPVCFRYQERQRN